MDRDANPSYGAPPSLAEAMEKIMAHPELISMVASALGTPNPSASTEQVSYAAVATSEESVADGSADKNVSAPTIEGLHPPASSEHVPSAEWIATLSPLLSGLSGKGIKEKGKGSEDPRSCLLRALKPYVSQGRREAIEYMIRISQISELLKRLS